MLLPLRDYLPHGRLPAVTLALIAINVLVFLLGFGPASQQNVPASVSNHDVWVYEWGTIPCELLARCDNQPGQALLEEDDQVVGTLLGEGSTVRIPVPEHNPWLTLFASAFIHGGLLHLVFNMLFLWVFGGNVEDSMSRATFLGFYLGGGIVAGLAQSVIDPNSAIPQIGASGAIAAVIGGYLVLYPKARVLTMVFLPIFLNLPAWVVAGGWGVLQFFFTWQTVFVPGAGDNGIAYMAHLAGFVFGAAVVRLFAQPNPIYDQLYRPEQMRL